MIEIARLKAAYRALPERRRLPPRAEAFAARVADRLLGRVSTAPVRLLEAKLLGGFGPAAEADLAAMAADPKTHPRRAAEAAWTLARWRADRGEPEAALAALAAMRARLTRARPGGSRAAEARLVEADCLIRLGRPEAACALLAPDAADPAAALLLANAEPDPDRRRALIASAFADAGGLDWGEALHIDALEGPPVRAPDLVSVIVPVHLHWDLARTLIACLEAQTLAQDRFETILVNNGGPMPDPMPEAGPGLRILDCPAPGAYAARNFGAARARGDLLVFTDADCAPEPGWLAALVAAAEAMPDRLIAGPVRMLPPPTRPDGRPNPYAAYDGLRGIPQEHYVRLGYAATANLAVPRAVFDARGGFDATRFSGGDAEFCRRAGRAGTRIALAADAVVAHPARADWTTLATKARRVKGGQIRGGAPRSRAIWLMRTLTPPLRATARFLRKPAPWSERRAAIGVLYRLWGVELAETARLLAGGAPERR